MVNVASPEGAFRWWHLHADGVGLARIESIIGNAIKIHPLALTRTTLRSASAARRRAIIPSSPSFSSSAPLIRSR
jgi:pyruvate, water dikinase